MTKSKSGSRLICILLTAVLMLAATFILQQNNKVYADNTPVSTAEMDNMIWSWSSSPQVITSGDKVFWGFMTSDKQFGVACYDKSTGTTTKKILDTMASQRNIETTGVALSLTSENKLMVAYATYYDSSLTKPDIQKKMVVNISTEPLSIDSFETKRDLAQVGNTACFSHLVESNGAYYLFCRVNAGGTWDYYKSTDNGNTWTLSSHLIVDKTKKCLCEFVPTSDPNLIRILMYSGPDGTDPDIRMGFLNTSDGKLYNADSTTEVALGGSYTAFNVVQAAESGKTQRLLDVAVTAPDKPRFIFASFTAGSADSVYKLYDNGTVQNICTGGSDLAANAQLGAAFRGTDEIVAARNADGNDIIESYTITNGGVEKKDTLYTHDASDGSRAARPIVDVNGKAFLWHEGAYTSSTNFSTAAKLMFFQDLIVPEIKLDQEEFIANGSVQKPQVTLEGLTEGTDYDLTWSDENSTDVGTYTVTATFKGDYEGCESQSAEYRIVEDPYKMELDAPHAGKQWGDYMTEGGFCQNTRVTLKAAAPENSGAWIGIFQASNEGNYAESEMFAKANVKATSLDDENASLDLAAPGENGKMINDGFLNGGCYKAVLFKDGTNGKPASKEIYFFIQGGHIYDAAQYVWADDNSTVTATRNCKGCDKVETETVNTTSVTTATCTENGIRTFTATFENTGFEQQTKDVEDPAARAVDDMINALPEEVTADDEQAIAEAREAMDAFNALEDPDKGTLDPTTEPKLEAAEAKLEIVKANAEAEQANQDAQTAKDDADAKVAEAQKAQKDAEDAKKDAEDRAAVAEQAVKGAQADASKQVADAKAAQAAAEEKAAEAEQAAKDAAAAQAAAEEKTAAAEQAAKEAQAAQKAAEDRIAAAEAAVNNAELEALRIENAQLKVEKQKVTGLKVKAKKKGKAVVSFKSLGEDYTYVISKSTKKNKGFKKAATTTTTKVTIKKGLKKGKTYYFKVRAYKNIGGKDIYTGYSKVVKIKAK